MDDLKTRVLISVQAHGDGVSQGRIIRDALAAIAGEPNWVENDEADITYAYGVIQGLIFARKLNRTVSGERSGRCYYLHLTDKGRAAIEETTSTTTPTSGEA